MPHPNIEKKTYGLSPRYTYMIEWYNPDSNAWHIQGYANTAKLAQAGIDRQIEDAKQNHALTMYQSEFRYRKYIPA